MTIGWEFYQKLKSNILVVWISNKILFWKSLKLFFSKKGSLSWKMNLVEEGNIISNEKGITKIMDNYFVNVKKIFES